MHPPACQGADRFPAARSGPAGITLLDLAPVFAAAARRADGAGSTAERLYLLGRFHLSDEGHRVAAQAIHDFLTRGAGRRLLGSR